MEFVIRIQKTIQKMNAKKAIKSFASTAHIVLPNDTNTLGNLMGGQLLKWMDITGAISAHRHCKKAVVTASVGNVSFQKPIKLGDIVTINAKVSRAFTTSMEVVLEVTVEDAESGEHQQSNVAMYTFVALDNKGKPTVAPELIPESEEEKERYDAALRRKQLNLILAGKLQPDEASELKALFNI